MYILVVILLSAVAVQHAEARKAGTIVMKDKFNERRNAQETQQLRTFSTKSPGLSLSANMPSSSKSPTKITIAPSNAPSQPKQSKSPTATPSNIPSLSKQTKSPTTTPTSAPSQPKQTLSNGSNSPTSSPSRVTLKPSQSPSIHITSKPSSSPSLLSLAPSSTPTRVATLSPSESPTTYDCTGKQDSSDIFFLPGDQSSSKTCEWVAQNEKELNCVVSAVRNLCPVTCGLCPAPPSSAPSSNPTLAPSSNPTNAPSSSPTSRNMSTYSSLMVLSFEKFSVAMDDKEKNTFQNTVKDFVTKTMIKIENVDIDIISVEVVSQLRSIGATNRLMDSRDIETQTDKTRKDRLLQETSTGLLVDLIVTGHVSYGSLPENFSFRDVVVTGFQNNYDVLLNDLEDAFSTYNAAENPSNGGGGLGTEETSRNSNNILIMYVSIGCGIGGLILAAVIFVFHRKRQESKRHLELQDQIEFSDIKPSLQTIGLESPAEVDGESRWSWVDPTENDIKKDLEDPYGLASSLYRSGSSSHHKSQNPMYMYSLQSSATNSSELVTPTGSASTTSLGINLSPEALQEARKQQQNFCFYPPDNREQSAISHSYPDQNGRLVYKSYVCYAPPGALGVIIDTTPEGPMVHAIKPTSQLLGTIAPGDIVVGLDNIETRHMTAPALTRLMARKAQQSERKITLLRPMTA